MSPTDAPPGPDAAPAPAAAPALVVTPHAEHGVAAYARDLAAAVARETGRRVAELTLQPEALTGHAPPARAHLHFTDRLWAGSPEEAAVRFEELAAHTAVSVTLHDLPQPSDGERNLRRRSECYARVVELASGVACNSRHERELLAEYGGGASPAVVIPLPVEMLPAPAVRPEPDGSVALIGFFYPGKGHAETVDALAALPARLHSHPLRLAALGRASPGHEGELDALLAAAAARRVAVEVTGYLDDATLVERCRHASVPVIAHRHVSASASLTAWIAAGRRPLVADNRYSREMDALRPGTLTLVADDDWTTAIARALDEPESTWLEAEAVTAPDWAAVARSYLSWWETL
ncbi:glycosyltransferase family protein [Frondihabitans cladoniiphilus]|uniref:Glycosyltransferase involved in cell wall biosynthesis n=1 Tax=Frondihabitans cladoniiphilus TaxID=715785 RepID=A0ABP8W3W4_9MICO